MPFVSIQDLKDGLDQVARVWSANPDFKLKTLTLEQFNAKVAAFDTLVADIVEKDDTLVTLRNAREAQAAEMWNVAVRTRAGIKGYFGDNSDQYELAGGIPTAKRKKPVRKAEPVDDRKAA